MAELVDALVSGASVERRAGSSPVLGTKVIFYSDGKNTKIETHVSILRGADAASYFPIGIRKQTAPRRRW